ncbi:hypothetical protein GCM10022293_37090 [Azospirillum formosense]
MKAAVPSGEGRRSFSPPSAPPATAVIAPISHAAGNPARANSPPPKAARRRVRAVEASRFIIRRVRLRQGPCTVRVPRNIVQPVWAVT